MLTDIYALDGIRTDATIPVFQRRKRVYALDRAATVIGVFAYYYFVFFLDFSCPYLFVCVSYTCVCLFPLFLCLMYAACIPSATYTVMTEGSPGFNSLQKGVIVHFLK
jgi:hypothetical protein